MHDMKRNGLDNLIKRTPYIIYIYTMKQATRSTKIPLSCVYIRKVKEK